MRCGHLQVLRRVMVGSLEGRREKQGGQMQNGGYGALEAHVGCTPKVPASSDNGGWRERGEAEGLPVPVFLCGLPRLQVLGTQS